MVQNESFPRLHLRRAGLRQPERSRPPSIRGRSDGHILGRRHARVGPCRIDHRAYGPWHGLRNDSGAQLGFQLLSTKFHQG